MKEIKTDNSDTKLLIEALSFWLNQDLLKKLYESEINFCISTEWNAGVEVELLDGNRQIIWKGFYETYNEAIIRLVEAVLTKFKKSNFAREIRLQMMALKLIWKDLENECK